MDAGADQLRLCGIILHQKAPGELLEPEELGQDRGGRNRAAVRQFCEVVTAEPVVDVPLFLAHGYVAVLEGLFREVEGFFLGNSVGNAVFLLDQLIQVPV